MNILSTLDSIRTVAAWLVDSLITVFLYCNRSFILLRSSSSSVISTSRHYFVVAIFCSLLRPSLWLVGVRSVMFALVGWLRLRFTPLLTDFFSTCVNFFHYFIKKVKIMVKCFPCIVVNFLFVYLFLSSLFFTYLFVCFVMKITVCDAK